MGIRREWTDGSWRPRFSELADLEKIAGMMFPVLCIHCGGLYDMAAVEVLARYADCDVWKTPCCKREVDNRTWLRRHYHELNRDGSVKQ